MRFFVVCVITLSGIVAKNLLVDEVGDAYWLGIFVGMASMLVWLSNYISEEPR